MEKETLELLWYIVVGVAMIMYTILDGFDLGVGALHLCTKKDQDRRIFLNAIGPVWDGNEVWIVIVLGALFAGFTQAYGTILSGFYNLMMVLIPGLMFRAAAIEFRSKSEKKSWRSFWDATFCFSSVAVALILGLLLGNLIVGIPLDKNFVYQGSFAQTFHPYAILVAIFGLSLFSMHGAIYLVMKTEGDLHEKMRRMSNFSISLFLFLFFVTTITTYIMVPHMMEPFKNHPWLLLLPLLMLFTILNVPYHIRKKRDGTAFIFSSACIVLLLLLFGVGIFPNIVRATPIENSLTYLNSASSEKTLSILLLIVLIGLPLVFAYGYWIYRVFKGKVQLGKMSY